METRALVVQRDPLVLQAHLVMLETSDRMVTKDLREGREQRVTMESKASLDHQV